MNKTILIILGVAVVAVGAFFLFRRKSATAMAEPVPQGNSFNSAPSRTVAAPTMPFRQPLAAPVGARAPSGGSFSVRQGLELAATAGCVAYSGGSLAPLCGIGAPLAVSFASKGATAVSSTATKLFRSIF